MTILDCFKCLSDETRLRCMMLVHNQGELCVCELTNALALSQPKISRHLSQLRHCELLVAVRRGPWMFYSVNPELPKWASDILTVSACELKQHENFRTDLDRLTTMSGRPAQPSNYD